MRTNRHDFMLKIGVLGTGHLGKIHLKCIKQSDAFELVGFYDPNQETAQKVAEEYELKAFSSIEELILHFYLWEKWNCNQCL